MNERVLVENIVKEHFITKTGGLNSQALTRKGFSKRNLNNYQLFEDLDILTSQKLYNFINNESECCPKCSNKRRFVTFKTGYIKMCERCSRTHNNYMRREGCEEFANIDNLRDKNGNFSSTKIKKLTQTAIIKLISIKPHLHITASIAEVLYCITNNINKNPLCVVCGKQHDRFIPNKGYKEYCSYECSVSVVDYTSRKQKQKSKFYQKYVNFYKNYSDENPDYTINMFSEDDYQKSNHLANVEFLHKPCNTTFSLNVDYQGKIHCPKCFPIRSKQQFIIEETLNKLCIETISNDRRLIKPKEIDLLIHQYKFGIEYDSLAFHSFGKSNYKLFDNFDLECVNKYKHVEKTELVEAENYQLFRIFSNEWFNTDKRDIWISMIKSKCHMSKRIYARKCKIIQITNKDANIFLSKNHLQGSVNSSLSYGIIFNDELMSVMTFAKPRQSKWNGEGCFEMMRFCTKIGFNIIGGASKLLKHFERNNDVQTLISYANRRWSVGNLYSTLNFKFIHNTPPNYFYFKGDDKCKLYSRDVFQKHKLSKILKHFDEKLTESVNMYINGYRKIYDCGSMLFIKKYDT